MALVCAIGVIILLAKWRIDHRTDTLLRIPSLLWLGFIYTAVWRGWFALDDPMMRTMAVRLPILILLVTLIIVDILGVNVLYRTRRDLIHVIHA